MSMRETYTRRMSSFFLWGLVLHWPVFAYLAKDHPNTGILAALGMGVFLVLPPVMCYFLRVFEKWMPLLIGFSSMGYSALLIHLAGGMIEFHFHIFVMLAALGVFGLWSPIFTAVVTVAVHHIGFFFLLPASVFNYQASFGIVLLHALFVILEAIPVLFIARQISKMIATQDTTLSSLNQMSQEMIDSIESMSGSGARLSTQASKSASSIEETAASLEEIRSQVTKNSENAGVASELSQKSREAAILGGEKFSQLIEVMRKVAESSRKIEDIINVIDDIAFQTNLLALNAAVEAARAGDQGKGFAVVADAVRTLAQRSAESARGIQSLIKDSSQIVNQGTTLAHDSELAIKNILDSIEKVVALNSEIADSSVQQSAGVSQISRAVNDLDKSSQENAQISVIIVQSSTAIKDRSQEMQALVLRLSDDIGLSKKSA